MSVHVFQPLADIRVVEFCQIAAGPFCGMLLADLGADVVKIENPAGGDAMRTWPPFSEGFSENFASLNRNKRSVALDLKTPEGRVAALDLCRQADVIVENNRPGVMDRLGLGYDRLHTFNPNLVYCSISGFGQKGPRANEGGFDVSIQAMAGVMSVTGQANSEPVKCGVPISDFSTGLYAAYSIATALRAVEAGSGGAFIDVSLMGATLGVAALQTSEFFGTGAIPRKLGSAHPRNAPYRAFRSANGHFVMAAGNDALWALVCQVIERPNLRTDPRFSSVSVRARNQDEMLPLLEDVFVTRDSEHWLERFRAAGVPCAPINNYQQALADPQVEAMGWISELDLPSGVRTRTFGNPVLFNGQTTPIRRGPPELGEHTDEVLTETRKKVELEKSKAVIS
ncbi:CoA transferase [Pelagibacterium nitratireducens]|uniref:CoA transferase n=1 Tax=Pelagibacterium nitratireducens TaxID=1046114 RepID=A0ABZ2I5X2_9HYPH